MYAIITMLHIIMSMPTQVCMLYAQTSYSVNWKNFVSQKI